MIFYSIHVYNEMNIILIYSPPHRLNTHLHNTEPNRAEQKNQPIPHKNLFHIVVVSNPRVYTYAFSADCSNCPKAQDTTQRYTQAQTQHSSSLLLCHSCFLYF